MNESRTKHRAAPADLRSTRIRRADTGKERQATRRGGTAGGVRRALRAFLIFGVVGGMFATVSLPAFASSPQGDPVATMSYHHGAAQRLAIGAVMAPDPQHDDFSATTQEELDRAKAAAAAAAKAKQAASALGNVDLNMVAAGSGAVRWPLPYYDSIGDGFMARGGEHQGVDLLVGAGTPIFAVAAGTVKVSSESYYGYGVGVVIEHEIGGQRVETTYGHMTYGSRAVQAGDTVAVGQLIGLVGSTGQSTANHLHFEVRVNGGLVDPLAWLRANAG
ncbi:M23 family metallopeptidase [Humibacter ginsengisoli]